MGLQHGEEFVEYLEDRFGPTLRSVLYDDYGDHEVLYARDDISDEYEPAKSRHRRLSLSRVGGQGGERATAPPRRDRLRARDLRTRSRGKLTHG